MVSNIWKNYAVCLVRNVCMTQWKHRGDVGLWSTS